MTGRELEKFRRDLRGIQKMANVSTGDRVKELTTLATNVGASTRNSQTGGAASEPELIDNVNDALRTEAMILASKTASRHFWISIIAAGAAVISAVAAWAAILYEVRY